MSAQPRDVRVAAVQAIGVICVAALKSRSDPPAAVVESLALLHTLAANHPTVDATALDNHLKARGFGAPVELANGATNGATSPASPSPSPRPTA